MVSHFDKTGKHGAILTTNWIGSERAISAFNVDTSQNQPVEDSTIVDGKTITMAYPADLVDRAGAGWAWNAVATLDGFDIDNCSNAAWPAVNG